jgi:hypothetical protein
MTYSHRPKFLLTILRNEYFFYKKIYKYGGNWLKLFAEFYLAATCCLDVVLRAK